MIKLAVLGANAPSLTFYKQAKSLGCFVIGIAWEEGAVCKPFCDKFYGISFKEKEEVLRICREEQVDGITSFSLESALPTLVYVAKNLGLVSNSEECLKLTSTKLAQRMAFERNGIPVPAYFTVRSVDEIQGKEFAYPIIVKPVDSGGSQGITKIDGVGGLASAIDDAIAHSHSGTAIIEEFIDGREFSVESLSYNGYHYILQITDKVTSGSPHFIEMQHHQPASISLDLAERIRILVGKALTALCITNSPSHTELKLNSKGDLYIIEIGARMGGDFISSDLVRLSTGYDMVKGAIALATGHFEPPVKTRASYSGVYFYSKLAPQVRDVIINHHNYPEIVEYEYDEGPLMDAHSNADRRGYFLYQSDSCRPSFD